MAKQSKRAIKKSRRTKQDEKWRGFNCDQKGCMMVDELIAAGMLFYGIAVGLFVDCNLWRKPNLNYIDDEDK